MSNYQPIIKEAELQSRRRQQPKADYSQTLKEAKLQSHERQQPDNGYQRALENARMQDRNRQMEMQKNISRQEYSSNGYLSSLGSKNKKAIKKSGEKREVTLNPFALLAQIDMLNDMPYFFAMIASLLKDLLDVIFDLMAVTLPIPIIISMMNLVFGIMMMQLAKFSETQEKTHARWKVKVGLYIAGAAFGSIPFLNFIPESIVTTVVVYFLTLWERANTRKTEKANAR